MNFRNQYITIERGQFITSKLKIAGDFWLVKKANKLFSYFARSTGYVYHQSGQEIYHDNYL